MKRYNRVSDHQELMILWSIKNEDIGLDPTKISSSSKTKAFWDCPNHDTPFYSSVSLVFYNKTGCGICDNKKVLVGFNDLWTTEPELSQELLNPLEGFKYTRGSGKKVWWRCSEDHIWHSIIEDRSKGGRGCPYCANKKVWVGFNDLWTTHPQVAKQLVNPENGYTVLKGTSSKKFWWSCILGHKSLKTPDSRKEDGTDCSSCSGSTTSNPEKVLQSVFPSAIHQPRYVDPYGEGRKKSFYPDFFIPEYNTYLEYDGCRYHIQNDKVAKDFRRTNLMLSEGFNVVRIREYSKAYPLPLLDIDHTNLLQIRVTYNRNMEHLTGIGSKIIEWVTNKL